MSFEKIATLAIMAYDRYKGRNSLWHKKYLEKSQWFTRQELERLKLKRLKALLLYAYENVPYYHESFKTANFRPKELKSAEDIRRIPVLQRKHLRTASKNLISTNLPRRQFVSRSTGGTTAAPVDFFRSKVDVSWGIGAELRGYGWAGYRIGDKQAMIWSFSRQRTRKLAFKLKTFFERDKILPMRDATNEKMAQFAQELERFKPDFIQGWSTFINIFANFLCEKRRLEISPKAVLTTAATLLPHYRKTIEEVFGCPVYDFYATSELSHIAAQCGEHEALHVNEENILLEVVDESQSSSSEEGKVLLTNLHNYAMPFIRYDIGDRGKIYHETCSCGRSLMLFKPIGRTYEYFVNSDGSFTFLRDFQTVFEEMPVKDFQVVQENSEDILIRIVPKPSYSSHHSDFVLENIKLKAHVYGKTRFRIELVEELAAEPSGKVSHIVSRTRRS